MNRSIPQNESQHRRAKRNHRERNLKFVTRPFYLHPATFINEEHSLSITTPDSSTSSTLRYKIHPRAELVTTCKPLEGYTVTLPESHFCSWSPSSNMNSSSDLQAPHLVSSSENSPPSPVPQRHSRGILVNLRVSYYRRQRDY